MNDNRIALQTLISLTLAATISVAKVPLPKPAPAEDSAEATVTVAAATAEKAEPDNHTAAPPVTQDVLQFFNGDSLRGTLRSIDAPGSVRWQHPDSKQVIEFQSANVASVKLARAGATGSRARHTSLVRLTNQNEFLGDLVSLDAETLVLDTWYAGKITLQRKMVQTIAATQGGMAYDYEGPTGLEGWTVGQGQGGWKFQNGAFYAVQPGSIGRDLKLPGLANVEFDLSWRGYLQFVVCFYTDQYEGYGGNCYMLQISNNYVHLQSMRANSGGNNLGQIELPNLQQKSRVHIALRVNKEEKTIALLVDGALTKQWRDAGQFAGLGTGILFFNQGQGLIRVSDVKVSKWDGKFEEPAHAGAKAKEDMVTMANNDKVSGTLQGIRDGKISFTTSYAKLEIPMQRVSQIEMAADKTAPPPKNPAEVRAFFADRGNVTFVLESWNDQQASASAPAFGKLKFVPTAFRLLQFNLPRQKPDAQDFGFSGEVHEGQEDDSSIDINN